MTRLISTIFVRWCLLLSVTLFFGCGDGDASIEAGPVQISGIYPHLAYYNDEGECGTGAVVPWADRLWVVTYSPHKPQGSSDRLYEITPDLQRIIREESVGGTAANRMIHRESQQLFIGPYAIDTQRAVRVIPYAEMPGRHTGNARHLSEPGHQIYYATMEEGFYAVDVASLDVRTLYKDGHQDGRRLDYDASDPQPGYASLPGAHGKGLYSGQGVLVYSNNGETTSAAMSQFDVASGALAEWDGKQWTVVRRNQFVEVTGPGGIHGNTEPATDPIWATGWDHKSVILGVRSPDQWQFYRLPKASHSYDGAHGWNTEWPRIRDIGPDGRPDYLMTMHGMFWRFPGQFAADHAVGIRPRSAYLKVIGDFARWGDRLVFGCDDSAQREFLNKRKHKGGIEGPGQSNSNLWFASEDTPDRLGPTHAAGAVWLSEEVTADGPSEPFLFAGWPRRSAWLQNHSDRAVQIQFEVDRLGEDTWQPLRQVDVAAASSQWISFAEADMGEWIRASASDQATLTLSYHYADDDGRSAAPHSMFAGLATVASDQAQGGLLYGLGDHRRSLGLAVTHFDGATARDGAYYELDERLQLEQVDDPSTAQFIPERFAIPSGVVEAQRASVLVIDDAGRRWRFPRGMGAHDTLIARSQLRICREVATERDLFHLHGTFYELPAENADGFAKVRPIASHGFRIHDYASYRGMLVMTGMDPEAADQPHLIRSDDGEAAVWVGVIDDLWQLGKPCGEGGPWLETTVQAGQPSDPYLMGLYDAKSLVLSHDQDAAIRIRIEVLPMGHGPWHRYDEVLVATNETYRHTFPRNFEVRWIRFVADTDCVATAWLVYE